MSVSLIPVMTASLDFSTIIAIAVAIGLAVGISHHLSLPRTKAVPLPPGDLLATNEVIATYAGLSDLPCRLGTAECPDRCDHATKLAKFKVIKNLKYIGEGQYADDKAESGSIVYVDVKKDIEGQNPSIAKHIAKMKLGTKVQLTITHFYVNKGESRYTIRPATSFQVLAIIIFGIPA